MKSARSFTQLNCQLTSLRLSRSLHDGRFDIFLSHLPLDYITKKNKELLDVVAQCMRSATERVTHSARLECDPTLW